MAAREDREQYLNSVEIDESQIRVRSLLVNLEKLQAVKDLHHDTYFNPDNDKNGPYDVAIKLFDEKMVLEITDKSGQELEPVSFALKPYRRLIQDYFLIVESYEKARLEGNTSRLEAIDMGRRGIHNEGAELLQARLSSRLVMNKSTSRRLFTLVCILCAGRNRLWF